MQIPKTVGKPCSDIVKLYSVAATQHGRGRTAVGVVVVADTP